MPHSEIQHEALNPIHPDVLPYLDPTFVDLYNTNVAYKPNAPIDLAFLRSKYSVLYSYGTAPAPDVKKEYDAKLPGHQGDDIDVRVYLPEGTGPFPVHIDFHGGGWGLGDLDTESHICKHICASASVAVIDVAYRLIPEFAYPTGILDSFAALQYIHSPVGASRFNIDPARISLGGVSAGANIALIVAHLARDAGIALRLVAAGTPTIDDLREYPSAQDSPFASVQQMEFAPTLNWARLKWFDTLKWSSISQEPEIRAEQMELVSWFPNALNAPSFKGLGRTLIYTAGCDPLRDEGEEYARRIREADGDVVVKRFDGVPHPFMHMDKALQQARDFISMTAAEIKEALHK